MIAAQWEADFAQRFSDMSALGLGNLATAQNKVIEGKAKEVDGKPACLSKPLPSIQGRDNGKQTYQATAPKPKFEKNPGEESDETPVLFREGDESPS